MLSFFLVQLITDIDQIHEGREVSIGLGVKTRKMTNDKIYGWTSDIVDDVTEEYSGVEPVLIIVGYILNIMVIYCGLTFLYFDWVRSHVSVGLVSVT